jgi:hypothetical protein
MWRCADLQNGNEFCGCGENDTVKKTGIYFEATSENAANIYIFIDSLELHAQTSVNIETDTGDLQVIV